MNIALDVALVEALFGGTSSGQYEIVSKGDWVSGEKWSDCHLIVRDRVNQKHFRLLAHRLFHPTWGYEYDWFQVGVEVEEREVSVKQWVEVEEAQS